MTQRELLELLEMALRSLQASMCRMDQVNYELALKGRLKDNPIDAIRALRAALAPQGVPEHG